MRAPSPLRPLSRRLAAIAALALGFAALPALAADAVFLVVSGEVKVARSGEPARGAARSGDELRSGDLIVTSQDGRAQLRFSDGAIVSLQPGTEFRIDDYRFDPQEQRGFFSLLRGAMRTATGAIGKRNRSDYRMRTPTATIGIRGTLYLAEETVCDPACAPGARAGLKVSVSEGRIAVRTSAGEIEVGEGSAAEVSSPDALPRLTELRPVLVPATLVARAATDLAGAVQRSAPPKGTGQGDGTAAPTSSGSAAGAAGTNGATAGAAAPSGGSAGAEDPDRFGAPDGPSSPLQASVPVAPASSRAPDGRLELLAASSAQPPNPTVTDGSTVGPSVGGDSTDDGGSTGGGS
ncbi:MAG: FecR domain-containing protein, partial [Gammaproteobacteria bacterium]